MREDAVDADGGRTALRDAGLGVVGSATREQARIRGRRDTKLSDADITDER